MAVAYLLTRGPRRKRMVTPDTSKLFAFFDDSDLRCFNGLDAAWFSLKQQFLQGALVIQTTPHFRDEIFRNVYRRAPPLKLIVKDSPSLSRFVVALTPMK
jgi:hypothetical protein